MTADRRGPKIAILGGGMAGLSAAWRLSEPDVIDGLESITVYQRGWRLGGKGASSRGPNGRIEEHGLHVWLGYYDNAFRLIRACYEEVDRERSATDCPIRSWEDAFHRSSVVGVEDDHGAGWSHWIATFSENDMLPGDEEPPGRPFTPTKFVERALRLLLDLAGSLDRRPGADNSGPVLLSGSPEPPRPPSDPQRQLLEFGNLVRQAEVAGVVGALELSRLLADLPTESLLADPIAGPVLGHLAALRDDLAARVSSADDARRTWQLVDLLVTAVRGVIADGLMTRPEGFNAVDHLDFREWLAKHGAAQTTLDSALLRGTYDLVFAYEEGDPDRPRFSAGLGLVLAGKMFFDYKGAIFWKMQAGMGDTVFAPLYDALRARGVRFEFFHRIDHLHLDDDHSAVRAVSLGRQARLRPGLDSYEPLVDFDGLPCFPDHPLLDQLDERVARPGPDSESHWGPRSDVEAVHLERGRDFDDVILATSLGMLPHVTSELAADSPRWSAMLDNVATVATQSLQLWVEPDEASLGWPHPGATVSGYVTPFDTYASMSHLLSAEKWTGERPRTLAYFCSVLGDVDAPPHTAPHSADLLVRQHAIDFLRLHMGHYWPHALADGDFRWELLSGSGLATGVERLDGQYRVAAIDPSDRYVQSLPGTSQFRLTADGSGYTNLHLAGDWIDCGLNAGCIEAATMSGTQAANSVLGLPLMEGITGGWASLPVSPRRQDREHSR